MKHLHWFGYQTKKSKIGLIKILTFRALDISSSQGLVTERCDLIEKSINEKWLSSKFGRKGKLNIQLNKFRKGLRVPKLFKKNYKGIDPINIFIVYKLNCSK